VARSNHPSEEDLVILQDTRERQPWEFEKLPVETREATLSTGDYTVPCLTEREDETHHPRFAIERKTGSDFLNALTWERERFEAELSRAREWPEPLVVVVEEPWSTFDLDRGLMDARDVRPAQVEGSISAWLSRYDVAFHFARSRRRAQWYAFCLLSHRVLVRTGRETRAFDSNRQASEKPDVDVYSDLRLLVDALERHDVTALAELETDALVALYTLCSDVQRRADGFRGEVRDELHERLPRDHPVSGAYGSVRRTSRRRRALKDDAVVLSTLEAAGIDRRDVMGVDRTKVDDALAVTELPESDVYEIEPSVYVRKAAVDETRKQERLATLDKRSIGSSVEIANLRRRTLALQERISALTSFRAGGKS